MNSVTAKNLSNPRNIWAEHALTPDGWQHDVLITLDTSGIIQEIVTATPQKGYRTGVLLPAMPNLHSHAFQRAMAGMTEVRGPDPSDSFWSWRKLMYKFLQHLTPEDIQSIAAFAQIEMLESGYTSVGEFHYLHHQANGSHYDNQAEMCERIMAATEDSGIGLTLLPVLYMQGGCDGRPLSGGQLRFGHSVDEFTSLIAKLDKLISKDKPNIKTGIAAHSLRAVDKSSLKHLHTLANGKPLHIHIAEQQAEVDEVQAALGKRPVEWLLENHPVDQNWCLIHATQMTTGETRALATTGAIVGLCPVTESNLGDGIFDSNNFSVNHGSWGIGTDSNVKVSLSEELRTLEYSQRLKTRRRAIHASPERSNGRTLYDIAVRGGAKALQQNSGEIAVGRQADLLALDLSSPAFIAVSNDAWLDAWIFASDDRLVTDVWACGEHLVSDGKHHRRLQIEERYRKTMIRLSAKL